MMGAPLTPLELRLERGKRISNASFDFLKRLYDWHPTEKRRSLVSIGERCVSGDVNLHIHLHAGERMWCLTFEAVNPVKIFLQSRVDSNCDVAPAGDDLPMFVHVRNLAEPSRPVAFHVWLKALDCCDMREVDTFEPTSLCVPNEILCRVHDRKLRALLFLAGIEFSEFKNEIIEGTPEVVTNLAHECAEPSTREGLWGGADIYRAMRRVWIEIERNGVSLFLKDDGYFPLKFSKVFFCPAYSFEAAVKRILEVVDHPVPR
jgi:hypothetical protein